MNLTFEALSPAHWKDLEAYFEFRGRSSGCWCMNHRMPIGLDVEGEPARATMKALVESGRVHGVLAYRDSDPIPVGWASLDKRNTLPGHDCVGNDIGRSADRWSIHCITCRGDVREQGVEARLLEAATRLAVELGGAWVEGYPEPGSSQERPFATWNTFNAHQSSFESQGFNSIERDFGSHAEFYHPMEKRLDSGE